MNILVIGAGGREHALIHAINRSKKVKKVYALPGNGGIADIAECVDIPVDNHKKIISFCKENDIALVVVGPEAPLVAGITDDLEAADILVFGPSKEAAQIEGSKSFMKKIAVKYGVSTAKYASLDSLDHAKAYVKDHGVPIVIKTDGLAAGKGVVIAQTQAEAIQALEEYFAGKFGNAGKKVVIEEYLEGEEVSFFAICDGDYAVAFGSAQDHKAVGEGDTGPNTGGMGSYSPAPVVTDNLHRRIMDTIIKPVVHGMAEEGIPYKGVLFAGLMIDKNGNPKLLEFNARFGDPECQALMIRLNSDIVPILQAAAEGDLGDHEAEFSEDTAMCVVMASKGYPGSYGKGTVIEGVERAEAIEGVTEYHAGTEKKDEELIAKSGRVLAVSDQPT